MIIPCSSPLLGSAPPVLHLCSFTTFSSELWNNCFFLHVNTNWARHIFCSDRLQVEVSDSRHVPHLSPHSISILSLFNDLSHEVSGSAAPLTRLIHSLIEYIPAGPVNIQRENIFTKNVADTALGYNHLYFPLESADYMWRVSFTKFSPKKRATDARFRFAEGKKHTELSRRTGLFVEKGT